MAPITIRIADDTYRTIAEEADVRDASMSEIGREYVEKGLAYEDFPRT